MSEDRIVYEKRAPRATIWLNRPEARNSMTEGMSGGFRDAIVEASRDPEVRVIVYRGKGEDFCAGSALDDLPLDDLGGVLTAFDPSQRNGFPAIFKGHRPFHNDEIPKMTVAVLHGFAVGGGFEIACDADFVIAAEDAKIGDLHVARGIVGGAGVLANVARMVGVRRMKDLVFGGRILSGTEAAEWGLANRAVPVGELDSAVDDLVEHLASISPRLTRLSKIAYGRSMEADKETLAALETMLLLNMLGSEDADEGINSFLERRDPVWAESRGDAGGGRAIATEFDVLHALRIKGMAPEGALATATGGNGEQVSAALATLSSEGLVEAAPAGEQNSWLLTPAGLDAHGERIAALREELAPGGIAAAYDSFLELNDPAKQLISRSQQGEIEDAELLFELEEISERVGEALEYAARHERRFGVYGERLEVALEQIGRGDSRYVGDPSIDSFHTVWFECHEDFLLTLGLSREE